MSARIDHAAEAQRVLHEAERYASSDWPLETGETKADRLAAAQVHATLALVEQQRIANLIAVATWNVDALRRGARKINGEPVDIAAESDRIDKLFAEVREALGVRL